MAAQQLVLVLLLRKWLCRYLNLLRARLHLLTECVINCIYSRTPLSRKLVIRISNYPGNLEPLGKYVENSTKLTCLEITG